MWRTTLLALVLVAPLSAQGVEQFVPATPAPASFIADVANVLPTPAHAALDARIRAIQDSGYGDIGVALLPTIGDYSPSQVGTAIYRAWKIGTVAAIGSAHRNVGVLILIVPKELSPNHKGECWIQTGIGAEGVVTDAASGEICRAKIIPHLQMRDYPAALTAGIAALSDRLHSDPGLAQPTEPDQTAHSGPFRWWQIPGALFAAIAAFFGRRSWLRNRPHRCPRCGKAMQRLDAGHEVSALDAGQRLEQKLNSVDYDVWQCTCSQLLVIPYKKIMSGYHECRACHYRTEKTTRHTITAATTVSSGVAEDVSVCLACNAERRERVVLPMISSSSGSSGSGGGGGGGSSFGGSGSTSGGGGGSSY